LSGGCFATCVFICPSVRRSCYATCEWSSGVRCFATSRWLTCSAWSLASCWQVAVGKLLYSACWWIAGALCVIIGKLLAGVVGKLLYIACSWICWRKMGYCWHVVVGKLLGIITELEFKPISTKTNNNIQGLNIVIRLC
jgi:hypothetical protein